MKKILLTALLFCFVVADEFFEPGVTIGGYGELHYTNSIDPDDDDAIASTKLDFHRWIMFVNYNWTPEWSLKSELEIEHNMIDGDGDYDGEVELEQAYVNYHNADGNWGYGAGVVLISAGIINETHEPPTFLSVERPSYNKYIIPTTWFDNGFAFYGKMGDFNLNATFTGDLVGDDIAKGIRSARKKGHYSTASNWTKTFQGSWTGMTGLKVGGSITMNDAPVSDDHVNGGEAIGVNLAEFNATYSANNMYARLEYGNISYTNNMHDLEGDDGVADYEVESSSGYYLDLGYDIASLVGCGDESNLYLWMRTSAYNKDDKDDAKEITLYGVMYKPMNNISFKFETGTAGDDDVMRVGLGYMF